ncbi:unnamed protein product [Prunus armeniaca]
MPEKGRRSSQRNELYSWLRSLQIDCSWPNSEAEPQICDSPDLPLHRAPLELLPPSVLRHPEELASINWAPERNENENAAGPTQRTAEIIGIFFSFFFWVPLSLGRASYGRLNTVAYILSGVTS